MLMDLLEDLFGELFFKNIRKIFEHLEDYSLFHPRKALVGKVALYLLITLGGTAWFALRARIAWAAGEETWMQLYLIFGLVYLFFTGLLCLCRLIRWRKKRQETMYDPRYQK